MQIEKKLGKVSVTEMVLITFAGALLLTGFSYLIFTLIFQTPFNVIFSKVWIILIFFPLTEGIIQPLMNRYVILTVESNDKSQVVYDKVEELLKQKEYHLIEQNRCTSVFEYKNRWKKLINFNQGKVNISVNENLITITGKRNILYLIETKLKYNNEINMT